MKSTSPSTRRQFLKDAAASSGAMLFTSSFLPGCASRIPRVEVTYGPQKGGRDLPPANHNCSKFASFTVALPDRKEFPQHLNSAQAPWWQPEGSDAQMERGMITIFPDGKGQFRSRIKTVSSGNGDIWEMSFDFMDGNSFIFRVEAKSEKIFPHQSWVDFNRDFTYHSPLYYQIDKVVWEGCV